MELTKVVVDGNWWYRGMGTSWSRLLIGKDTIDDIKTVLGDSDNEDDVAICDAVNNRKGHMCCLGFASLAKGCSEYQIRDVAFPEAKWFDLDGAQCPFDTVAEINDDPELTDAKRIEMLKEEGKKIGVEFEFINVEG